MLPEINLATLSLLGCFARLNIIKPDHTVIILGMVLKYSPGPK